MQESTSSIRTASDPALVLLEPGTLALAHASRRIGEVLGFTSAQLRDMTLSDIVLHPPPGRLREQLLPAGQSGDMEATIRVLFRGQRGRTIPAELLLVNHAAGQFAPLAAVVCFGVERPLNDDTPRLAPGDVRFVDFAGRLGHDLNNLLSTVIGSLGLMREDLSLDSGDGGSQLVDDALSASRECADLVDRLMTAAGKQLLRPQRIAVNSIINRLTPLLKQTLPESIELSVSVDTAVADINVDPDRLESAILDLVVNAREAMPTGGTLAITSSMGKLSGAGPMATADPGYVRITVSDAGRGISEEVRDRILEPLFTTKSSGTGRGLGLSMVNGFVQQSQGTLVVESAPGEGTRVTLNFPRAD